MKRVLITLAAAVLLTMAVGVATAYGGGPIAPPTTGTENTYQGASAPASVPVTSPGQSQAPAQSNTAQNDQLSLVGEAQASPTWTVLLFRPVCTSWASPTSESWSF